MRSQELFRRSQCILIAEMLSRIGKHRMRKSAQLVRMRSGCWIIPDRMPDNGYTRLLTRGGYQLLHKWLYEKLYGKIRKPLCLDHLCRNRACCNPEHLEVVTLGVNVLRGHGPAAKNKTKTHCLRGHKLSGSNLRIINLASGRRYRVCIKCNRAHHRRYYHATKDTQ